MIKHLCLSLNGEYSTKWLRKKMLLRRIEIVPIFPLSALGWNHDLSPDSVQRFVLELNTSIMFPVQLIAYLAKVANMTIVPTVIESEPDKLTGGTKQKDGSWSGSFGYIYNDTLDTVCLLAQRNEMRAKDFDFTRVSCAIVVNSLDPVFLVSRQLTETMPPNLWSPYEVLSWQVLIRLNSFLSRNNYVCVSHKQIYEGVDGNFGWLSFTVILTLLESWQGRTTFFEIFATVMELYNFISFIYSMTALAVVANLYGSNTITAIMKERSFERFHSIEEAAAMVAAGKLTLIDYASSIKVTLLGEYSTSGTRLFKEAVNINPPLAVNDLDQVFSLLQTGRYLCGEIIDSRFMMKARTQCNLTIFDQGLPDLFVQLLWNRKHRTVENNKPSDWAEPRIHRKYESVLRTRKKYLALDELPFTVLKKNCAEQKRVLANFPSTAGIFLLVLTGLIASSSLLSYWRRGENQTLSTRFYKPKSRTGNDFLKTRFNLLTVH
ncbi:hypothetical protein PRIPAC_77542 [Pristionchus pacificus]|uniref:Uncharacterized protein n=1 Tax=Pristionchus pacificus TaxID=54126 RepID=A0A2A6CJF2_PRIPA|nr:hypothetical protein PRIPAC_77542 [Pristionchus pacificus]|eukprot:PDM78259.1 hypothetical protein PRIPAC_30838 [Pristionchus pacificus]